MERQETVDDDKRLRGHADGFGLSPVGHKIVDRAVDRVALSQRSQMGDEQRPIKRLGTVEVECGGLAAADSSETR